METSSSERWSVRTTRREGEIIASADIHKRYSHTISLNHGMQMLCKTGQICSNYGVVTSSMATENQNEEQINPEPSKEHAWINNSRSNIETLFSEELNALATLDTSEVGSLSLKYSMIDRSLRKLNLYLNILIPSPEEISDYLLRYQDIFYLVLYGCNLAYWRFIDQAQLSLEVKYPCTENEYLALYVRQKTYDPEILEQISTMCEVFEQEFKTKEGWFIITTDFCSPR